MRRTEGHIEARDRHGDWCKHSQEKYIRSEDCQKVEQPQEPVKTIYKYYAHQTISEPVMLQEAEECQDPICGCRGKQPRTQEEWEAVCAKAQRFQDTHDNQGNAAGCQDPECGCGTAYVQWHIYPVNGGERGRGSGEEEQEEETRNEGENSHLPKIAADTENAREPKKTKARRRQRERQAEARVKAKMKRAKRERKEAAI